HAHIMLTMRPLDKEGQWQGKATTAYLCRKDNTEKSIPASEIKQAEADGWQKQYQYKVGKKKVWLTKEEGEKKGLNRVSKQPKSEKIQNPITTEWNSKDTLFRWRKSWADMCNESLKRNGIDEQITHLSYEAQGVGKVATAHMGVAATYAEKRGIRTELGDLNRRIQSDNAFLEKFEKQIKELEQKETERLNQTAARLESLRSKYIAATYQQLCLAMRMAQEESSIDTQLQTTLALARTAEQIMKAAESLEKSLSIYQEQKKKLNPVQVQKRKELEGTIISTEQQIQNLKNKLDGIQEQQKQVKKVLVSSPEIIEQKKKQIQRLKEIRSETYQEFYSLVKENSKNMTQLRELIRSRRNGYDNHLKEKLKEHYAADFKEKVLEQARAKAPEVTETDAAGIQKRVSHKR
ncbi:MAG: MobA/MobL family protein, partial [Lachnospiraceae bacterium]|nr:MobA/MobL family protein [Lachnospiraceae bacterium]